MRDNVEDLLGLLQGQIADVVANFEQRTDIRIEHLEIDNRMRGVGFCGAHNIIVSADID